MAAKVNFQNSAAQSVIRNCAAFRCGLIGAAFLPLVPSTVVFSAYVQRPHAYPSLRTHQIPLFAFLEVVQTVVVHNGRDVELTSVVLPRLEDEVATLVVEREPRNVDRAM